jgi:methylmalonyl-CoA mutase N-terminal domain/subunit
VDAGSKTVVGVNRYISQDNERPEILKIGEEVEREQLHRLAELRRTRDEATLQAALRGLREGAARGDNLIPLMLAAVRAYGTVGEISQTMVPVFGLYREVSVL